MEGCCTYIISASLWAPGALELSGSQEDDCACPADGLGLTGALLPGDETLLRAVQLFLQPVDGDLVVGYSPFVTVGRSY